MPVERALLAGGGERGIRLDGEEALDMPFIRVPDATEGEIQKATGIGAVGIMGPDVDMVEKARQEIRAVRMITGRRSTITCWL
jgi:2-keto-3-deoxy-L-rhamnonate aldolase RhmA